MDMLTDAALLQLVWLASPALPVGGFSYSEGLEAAVEAGLVRDEGTASEWIVQQLHVSLARADLAVVAAVAGDSSCAPVLDAWVRQTRETSELRQQAEQMGRSLSDWQRSLHAGVPASPRPAGDDLRRSAVSAQPNPDTPPRTYPVAFALAAARTGASPRHVALTFAFSWAENMVQSAIKAVPLGQSAGQRILARLAQEIPAAADHALGLGGEERQAFTPMLAILSARHETQYSRLFRS